MNYLTHLSFHFDIEDFTLVKYSIKMLISTINKRLKYVCVCVCVCLSVCSSITRELLVRF